MTSMSDKPAIDLATRARWQRWEMDSLEAAQSRRNRRLPGQDQPSAEMQQKKTRVLEEAHKQGLAKGYQEGFAQGRKDGYDKGLEAGKADGHEAGKQTGHDEGYAAGLAQGKSDGLAHAREQAARLDTMARACAGAINSLEQEVGQKIIDLSIHIAEQVLRSQIRNRPDHILDLLQEILTSRPEHDTSLHLHLNPSDIELVNNFLQHDAGAGNYRLISDEQISAGGCMIETTYGSIDATIETRWKRIIAALGQPDSNESR